MYVHPTFAGHRAKSLKCVTGGLTLYMVRREWGVLTHREWDVQEGDELMACPHPSEDFYYAYLRKSHMVNDEQGLAEPLEIAIITEDEIKLFFERRVATITDNYPHLRGARKGVA